MKVGIVGLGKMGEAIAYRLTKANFQVFGFDLIKKNRDKVNKYGVKIVNNLNELAELVNKIWIMVPEGKPVDSVISQLLPKLKKGSILIDGGNSHFLDSIKRAKKCLKHGITFLDCGTSGGLQGKEIGYCLMIGGDKREYNKLKSLFKAIAAPNGFEYIGPPGSGHYVKMIHNGIEYALLEAYSEGFNLLKHGSFKKLDLAKISQLWLNGSIIRSWILQLASNIFKKDQDFAEISKSVQFGKTAIWTIQDAKEHQILLPLIKKSIEIRQKSKKSGNYATKLVSLLRYEFGGHEFQKIGSKS